MTVQTFDLFACVQSFRASLSAVRKVVVSPTLASNVYFADFLCNRLACMLVSPGKDSFAFSPTFSRSGHVCHIDCRGVSILCEQKKSYYHFQVWKVRVKVHSLHFLTIGHELTWATSTLFNSIFACLRIF
jgi:hypothetical protein